MDNQMALTPFDSTMICIDTDADITGYGETCPLGPVYLPAYGKGRMAASTAPGLGVTLKEEVLGKPVLIVK